MKTALIVFKKELKRFLTDRRMLITLILPGILIFLVYSLMGNFFSATFNETISPDKELFVYIDNQPEEFATFEQTEEYKITVKKDDSLTKEEKKAKVYADEAQLYIVYSQDFFNAILTYTPEGEKPAPQVEIYYNSTNTESQVLYFYYTACLDAFEESLANLFDVNVGGEEYDLATDSDVMKYVLTMVLPMVLNMLLFSGCMAVSPESIAG
ncbi:MAG: hypothetical protein J6Z36_01650 [Clostridia bacterium]|nr:hypothetical protein [Clostridia bacterium]